ncbi:uracil-DNA glycosylase [Candidatus Bipolaricaulota bacterium]|nr:uracil-DNA glycosylase [Candidatus Bipolaricaulota bacterium]
MSTMQDLKSEIRNCGRCPLADSRNRAVPGEGDLSARLFLVGQAPGVDEDEEGRVFVGRSGKILGELLDGPGLSREEIYLTNLIKCFLPGYRRPKRGEIDACSKYLDREIEIVAPEFLIPLGYYPARYILHKYGINVPEDKSEIFNRLWYSRGQKIFPLGHPAILVYDKEARDEMVENYDKLRVLSSNCKWYEVCPMRRFNERGVLDDRWIETYCKGDWESCQRYQMEENGDPHPDYILPDGSLSERLRGHS